MIIVTGGAGFIGSNIVRALNERNRADILIVDDLNGDDKYKNLIGLKFLDYQHKDDFIKEIQRVDFGKNVEAIFHEGACSDTMEYDVNFMMKTPQADSFYLCVERVGLRHGQERFSRRRSLRKSVEPLRLF